MLQVKLPTIPHMTLYNPLWGTSASFGPILLLKNTESATRVYQKYHLVMIYNE